MSTWQPRPTVTTRYCPRLVQVQTVSSCRSGGQAVCLQACSWDQPSRVLHPGHLRAVKLLLQLGAKVNRVDKQGHNALFMAARNGDTPMVRELVSKGAKTTIADFINKRTPLMEAASRNLHETVEVLLGAKDAAVALAAVDAEGRGVAQLCGTPALRSLLAAKAGHPAAADDTS